MKKHFLKIISLFIIILNILSLTACSGLFYSGQRTPSNQQKSTPPKEVTITLMNDSMLTTTTATVNQQLTITTPVKNGCYFIGYYDSESDGNCYINEEGISTSVWQEGFPTTLYAHWNSISGMSYDSEVDCETEAKNISYYSTTFFYKLPQRFINAIKGNLNEQLHIVAHYKAKEKASTLASYAPLTVILSEASGDSGSRLDTYTFTPGSDYQSYNTDFYASARDFQGGTIYIIFSLGYTYTNLYLKNVSITVSFK